MKAVILAAGYATRLYPLTLNCPKPLLPIGRQTILDYLLENMARVEGLEHIYLVTNKKFAPHFRAWLEQQAERLQRLPFTLEIIDDGTDNNETRLGAIADLLFAVRSHEIQDDVLVSAGDNIFTFDFAEMQRQFRQLGGDVIAAYRIDSAEKLRRSGVVQVDANRQVIGFEEKPQQPRSNLTCPTLYFLSQATLRLLPDYLAEGGNPDAPGHFIAWLYPRQPVYIYLMAEPCHDVGNLPAYEAICQRLA